ncbi:hypothetical protein C9415_27545 [Kluyvera sp. Nf5]|nr:hypothetical protein C9415_27545 [Kluyvera sp. Nf5]
MNRFGFEGPLFAQSGPSAPTCLQLWNTGGLFARMEGDPMQVADWLKACHDAGIVVGVQVNESQAPYAAGRAGTPLS